MFKAVINYSVLTRTPL